MRSADHPSRSRRARGSLRRLPVLLGLLLTMPLLAGCTLGDLVACGAGDLAACAIVRGETPPPPPVTFGAPTGLTAAIEPDGHVRVAWNANPETEVTGYKVYRATFSSDGYLFYNVVDQVAAPLFVDSSEHLDGTTYSWVVTAVNAAGQESQRSSPAAVFYCAPGHTCPRVPGPPASPTGLVAVEQSAQTLTLDWNDNTEADLGHYTVHGRSEGPCSPCVLAPAADSQIELGVTGFTPFKHYFFFVTALDDDGDGLESGHSNEIDVYFCPATVPGCPPAPGAATNLHLVSRDAAGVSLDWDPTPGTNVARYVVFRGPKVLGTPLSSSFVDQHPDAQADNVYVVAAVDADGRQGPRSNELTVRWCGAANPTCTTGPAAPTGLTATRQPFQVALDWADNTETDLAGYNVEFAFDAPGPPWNQPNRRLLTASQFTVVDLPANRTVFFRVIAVDTAGHLSPPSTVVSSSACSAICSLFSVPSHATRNATAVSDSSAFKLRLTAQVTPGTRALDGLQLVGTGESLGGSFVLRPAPAGLDRKLRKLAANGLAGTLRGNVDWRLSPILHSGSSTTLALATFANPQLGKACLRLTETLTVGGRPARLATQGTFALLGGSPSATALFGEGTYTVKTRRDGRLVYSGRVDRSRTIPSALPAECVVLDR